MAYARRNQSEDIRANRVWTADDVADLASIPAKHGDMAFEDTNNHAYVYVDGAGWVNVSQINVATQVTGVLDETNGGTGQSTLTEGDILYASATNTLSKLAIGGSTSEYAPILGAVGTLPTWTVSPSLNVLTAQSLAVEGSVDLSHASAGQIVFPATQNPSAGANTLDDYEEGTWTPGLSFGAGTTGLTYASGGQDGTYTKVGRLVYAQFRVELSAKGSSTGVTRITDLPFTSVTGDDVGMCYLTIATNMAGLAATPSGYVQSNATTCRLYDWGATGIVSLAETNFTDTTVIAGVAVYLASA